MIEVAENPQGSRDGAPVVEEIEDMETFKHTKDFIKQIPTSSDPRGLVQGLHQIFQLAISLDKEISRQAARVEWDLPRVHTGLKFNAQCMTVAREQERLATTDEVRLVTAPRMIKRGKSAGSDFHIEIQLLPMEVSLMPAPDSNASGLSSIGKWFRGQ